MHNELGFMPYKTAAVVLATLRALQQRINQIPEKMFGYNVWLKDGVMLPEVL